ncbi:MAG: FecR domain-containing protein [Deltaproteobacteria bacterium]|nr:FecR domain-containing protein [Deltaproteobacteria bacterium]
MRAWLICILAIVSIGCREEPSPAVPPDGGDSDQAIRTAKLVFVEGEVRVKRSGESEWLSASTGMQLSINDKVRTQRSSFATIEFERGGVLRMEPESLVAVTDLYHELRSRIRRSTFTIEQGRVEAEMDAIEREGSEFKIRTPTAEARVVRREVVFQ